MKNRPGPAGESGRDFFGNPDERLGLQVHVQPQRRGRDHQFIAAEDPEVPVSLESPNAAGPGDHPYRFLVARITMDRGCHPVQHPGLSPVDHGLGAGVKLVGVFDGRFLQELEHAREQEDPVAIDVSVGYRRVQNQFLRHGGVSG